MHIVLHVGVLALTVLVLSRVTSGVWLKNPPAAITVAVVFSLLNWALGWLLRLLLVVPTILTLGLLLLFTTYIVNTVLLWLADKLLPSFEIKTTRALLLSSSAITLVNWLFHFMQWR
ncbi:MAG: phage holin family protein [Polyangia bacterium]|jgi:putative membrane protein